MSLVFSSLVVEHTGPNRWKLAVPLHYTPTDAPSVVVPAGFECDLASIPRPFWSLLSPQGNYAKAAVLHDWLYTVAAPRSDAARLAADRAFLKAMKEEGVRWLARTIMYRAVRRFGGLVFYRRRSAASLHE